MQPLEMPRVGSWRATPYEIRDAIKLLEDQGYLVRKPSEADLPVVVELMDRERHGYEIDVRCDTTVDGRALCVAQRFPVELLLNPDDATFREQDAPRILGRQLGDFIAKGLSESIATALKAKVDPLVPEKRMSLHEIENFLAYALADPMRRVERDDRA